MNDMSAVAHDRLIAQIAEALFGQPGMSLMEMANRRGEIEALVKDAGRYRWLRSHAGKDDGEVEVFIGNESWAPGHLDAQIDAAMKEQAE